MISHHISCGRNCGQRAWYLVPSLAKVLCCEHAAQVAAERPLIPIEVAMDQAMLMDGLVGLHPLVHALNKDKRAA